jgi:hypothetical protein
MRKLMSVILVSCLLVTLLFLGKENIPPVQASPDIYQGDLVLAGNNVTAIEGRFDINGSIIVEENATLHLKNAVLNFTQSENRQFDMAFQNPLNGNPRLMIENATITSEYVLYVNLHANSSVVGDNLSSTNRITVLAYDDSFISLSNSSFGSDFLAYDSSIITMSDSSFKFLNGHDYSNIAITNCTITANLNVHGNSTVNAMDCTIDNVHSQVFSVNCSFNNLQQGIVRYWNLRLNGSVMLAPTGWTPNITLLNTGVDNWSFMPNGSSNVTISNTKLAFLWSYGSASTSVYNSTIRSWIDANGFSTCYLYDTTIENFAQSNENSTIWLVNSTYYSTRFYDSGRIYVSWYLGVNVIDSIDQDVPSANVTATYPNATVVESRWADANGRAKFTLLEKMMNATGEYPVGNYTVEATYDIYSDVTTVNMTENQQIILTLADFVIPEFPSFLVPPLLMIATLAAVIAYKRKQTTIS